MIIQQTNLVLCFDWPAQGKGRSLQCNCSIAAGTPELQRTLYKHMKSSKPSCVMTCSFKSECVCVLVPRILSVFAALWLDQCVNGSLQKFLAEAAVQLCYGIDCRQKTHLTSSGTLGWDWLHLFVSHPDLSER